MLALTIVSGFLITTQSLSLLSILTIGIFQYYLVTILHECVHLNFLESKKLSRFIGKWIGASLFISFEAYQKEHRAHHRHTTLKEDPDRYIYHFEGKMNLASILLWIVMGGLHEAYTKQHSKGVLAHTHRAGIARILLAQIILLIFFYLLSGNTWWSYFIFWTTPLLSIAFFINRTRIILEHGFGRIHSEGIDFNTPPLFIRMVYFPFAFNYHHSHHMHPALPAYRLKKLSAHRPSNQLTLGQYYRKLLRGPGIEFNDFSSKSEAPHNSN